MSAETMAALAAMRPVIFCVWSLVAVPSIAALYCMGFLFKRPGIEKYYVIPKCTGSFLCVGSAALAIALGRSASGNWSSSMGIMLLLALALCMLGDFLIEYKLLAGGLAFGVAHIVLVLYAPGTAENTHGAVLYGAVSDCGKPLVHGISPMTKNTGTGKLSLLSCACSLLSSTISMEGHIF